MDAVSIRICIADDYLLIITGIRQALEDAQDLDIVGVTQRGDEVLALVDEHRPDVVLLDHHMPGMNGLMCLRLIREQHPDVKVVMLSASENSDHVKSTRGIWRRLFGRSSRAWCTRRDPTWPGSRCRPLLLSRRTLPRAT